MTICSHSISEIPGTIQAKDVLSKAEQELPPPVKNKSKIVKEPKKLTKKAISPIKQKLTPVKEIVNPITEVNQPPKELMPPINYDLKQMQPLVNPIKDTFAFENRQHLYNIEQEQEQRLKNEYDNPMPNFTSYCIMNVNNSWNAI